MFLFCSTFLFNSTVSNEHKQQKTESNQNKSKSRSRSNKCMFGFCDFIGFPFYTIGRFMNSPCLGANQLMGTCVLAGECKQAGGIATGSCNSLTRQATCCVCKKSICFYCCLKGGEREREGKKKNIELFK